VELSLAYDIGGELKAETKEGEGTKFIIFFTHILAIYDENFHKNRSIPLFAVHDLRATS